MNENLNKNDENSIFEEFKGTIGKWGISNQVGEKSELTKIFNGDGNTVCAIYTKPFTETEKKANALLISKAPEMLEMLIECEQRLSIETNSQCDFVNKVKELIKQATQL